MWNLIFRTIVFYISVFILFTIIYILLFHTPLFQYQKVLFYRGILLLIPATLFVGIILTTIVYRWYKIRYDLLIAAVLLSISLNINFFLLGEVVQRVGRGLQESGRNRKTRRNIPLYGRPTVFHESGIECISPPRHGRNRHDQPAGGQASPRS